MRCQNCGSWAAEDEQHCALCGLPPAGQAAPRPRRASRHPQPAPAAEPPGNPPPSRSPTARRRQAGAARQAPPPGKVIPFESIAPARAPAPLAASERPQRKPQASRGGRPGGPPRPPQTSQASLPFPPPPVPPAPTVWREASVAPVGVRCAAAGVDLALSLVGLAAFLAAFRLMGGRLGLVTTAVPAWGVVAVTLALFYRIFWCALGRDTAGMRYFGLRLLNFDGYEPESGQRTARLVAACLSVMAGGLGLLWALVDEEKLTWHDHISKTFPTLDNGPPGDFRRG